MVSPAWFRSSPSFDSMRPGIFVGKYLNESRSNDHVHSEIERQLTFVSIHEWDWLVKSKLGESKKPMLPYSVLESREEEEAMCHHRIDTIERTFFLKFALIQQSLRSLPTRSNKLDRSYEHTRRRRRWWMWWWDRLTYFLSNRWRFSLIA